MCKFTLTILTMKDKKCLYLSFFYCNKCKENMSLFQREFLSCQFSHYENCLAKNYNYFILKNKNRNKGFKIIYYSSIHNYLLYIFLYL